MVMAMCVEFGVARAHSRPSPMVLQMPAVDLPVNAEKPAVGSIFHLLGTDSHLSLL
ncbi:MAG: hypothetical protein Kow0056_07090 [Coriobacteriia bacterium]